MKITTEINSLYEFEAWSGAVYTKKKLMENGIDEEFITCAEDILGDEISDTALNDFLWLESDIIFDYFGLDEDGNPKSEDEDEEDEDEEDGNPKSEDEEDED